MEILGKINLKNPLFMLTSFYISERYLQIWALGMKRLKRWMRKSSWRQVIPHQAMLNFIQWVHTHTNFLNILKLLKLLFCSIIISNKIILVTPQVSVERGMSWEDATHIWAEQSGPEDGFYVQVRADVSHCNTDDHQLNQFFFSWCIN